MRASSAWRALSRRSRSWLADEHLLLLPQQHRVGRVDGADAYQVAVLAEFALDSDSHVRSHHSTWRGGCGAGPDAAAAGAGGLASASSGQFSELGHQLVDLQRDAGDVDGRRRLEPLDVAREHAPQRQEARRLEAGQARVGGLQRRERGRHVAGELQFLRAERDQPLHLDEHGFVTAARQVRIQLLERLALALDLGEARLEHGGLLPRRARFRIGARGGFAWRRRPPAAARPGDAPSRA